MEILTKGTPLPAGASPLHVPVGALCTHAVVTADGGMSAAEAARLMGRRGVGALVIVDESGPGHVLPLGIVTDRDLAVGVLGAERDIHATPLREVMSAGLVTAAATDSALDVLAWMRRRRVRRVPVTGAGGELVGIVTLDDLLASAAGWLQAIVSAVEPALHRADDAA